MGFLTISLSSLTTKNAACTSFDRVGLPWTKNKKNNFQLCFSSRKKPWSSFHPVFPGNPLFSNLWQLSALLGLDFCPCFKFSKKKDGEKLKPPPGGKIRKVLFLREENLKRISWIWKTVPKIFSLQWWGKMVMNPVVQFTKKSDLYETNPSTGDITPITHAFWPFTYVDAWFFMINVAKYIIHVEGMGNDCPTWHGSLGRPQFSRSPLFPSIKYPFSGVPYLDIPGRKLGSMVSKWVLTYW